MNVSMALINLLGLLYLWGSIHTSDGSGSKIFDPDHVGSIFCGSGQVGKYPGQSRVGLLFTAGQK